MKLIYCASCHDVIRLVDNVWRKCECGMCGGQYNADLMTATIGGYVGRVFGIGNPFFNEFWPLLTDEAKEKVRNKYGYTKTDCWYGDYKGERQLFHIDDPDGPRVDVRVIPRGASNKVIIRHHEKRKITIDGRTDIHKVTVPANLVPLRKIKVKEEKKK